MNGLTPSRAGSLPQLVKALGNIVHDKKPVGASLLAKAIFQAGILLLYIRSTRKP
ncbi:hypothetical protein PG5_58370 [Pseudomonas sp. G5(2012)]|nr:hypothetical protein PG5_58370 [Pseudomonas sp. G5(2012)]